MFTKERMISMIIHGLQRDWSKPVLTVTKHYLFPSGWEKHPTCSLSSLCGIGIKTCCLIVNIIVMAAFEFLKIERLSDEIRRVIVHPSVDSLLFHLSLELRYFNRNYPK